MLNALLLALALGGMYVCFRGLLESLHRSPTGSGYTYTFAAGLITFALVAGFNFEKVLP